MNFHLSLDYRVPTGCLEPFFEGLRNGVALAERCEACGRVQFPPGGVCGTCGGASLGWVTLAGTGTVILRTDTPDRTFALVRFDGAANAALVEIANPAVQTGPGMLMPPPEGPPRLFFALTDPAETPHA